MRRVGAFSIDEGHYKFRGGYGVMVARKIVVLLVRVQIPLATPISLYYLYQKCANSY